MVKDYYQFRLNANYDSVFNFIKNFASNTGQVLAANYKSGFFMFSTSRKFIPKGENTFFHILVKNEVNKDVKILLHIYAKCDSPTKNSEMVIKSFDSFKDQLIVQFGDSMEFEGITFNATQEVSEYLEIDQVEKIALIYSSDLIGFPYIFKFNNLISYELLEDGEVVTSGGLGSAIIGAMTFGGVGAIVGAATGKKKNCSICSSLKIKLTINDPNNPNMFTQYIDFLIAPEKRTSPKFISSLHTAQSCCSLLEIVLNEKNVDIATDRETTSDINSLKKYHELLECGIITQEDYDLKKKQILKI